jgi:hypothetical protein
MLLAREAPDWIEAMAISSRPTGNNVEARLRGGVFMQGVIQGNVRRVSLDMMLN